MLSKLTGWITGIDAQKSFDTVASGVDAVFYTDEEKAEMHKKIIDAKLVAISKQSIARRIIAVAITLEAILLVNVTVILHIMGLIGDATFVKALLVEFMLQPFLAVVGFYFLTQLMSSRK